MSELIEWCAVIGTSGLRLTFKQDIQRSNTDQYKHLHDVTGTLLPVGGIPLLDHWIHSLSSAGITCIIVVSDSSNHSDLVLWAVSRGLPISTILKCCSTAAFDNFGTLDLDLLFNEKRAALFGRNLLFVQGDTLIHSEFKLTNFLSAIPVQSGAVAFDGYISTDFDGKPTTEIPPSASPSVILEGNGIFPRNEVRRIRPQLYAYRANTAIHIQEFIKVVQDRTEKLSCDLQTLLNWLILTKGANIIAHKLGGILRTESLAEYEAALAFYSSWLALQVSSLPRSVTETCCARVGLMGNPSDGFHGRTLSFLIRNFQASVSIEEHSPQGNEIVLDIISAQYRRISLVPHPILDPSSFSDMAHMQLHTVNKVSY